ncbi:MAG TPA: SDR family oxidoreductase [Solirubrobacterales bacterium]|jgi:NAD(P)-dependent dehydrogenase (short-subunit alcohol dehydrogenase family)
MGDRRRVALVTGGGRGIGRAIAQVFAEAGITVAITGRNAEVLSAAAAEVATSGGAVSAHPCDVSDEAAVAACVEDVIDRHGGIDILVNNAGIAGPTANLQDVSAAEWDEVQAINVRGPFLCTRAVAPHMLARGSGHVLFVSALGGGLRAYPSRLPYAVSKAALLAMTQTVAAELRPGGIGVNAVTPGPVKGERLERVFAGRAAQSGESVQAIARQLAEKAPALSFPDELEVARVALFLCSPEADHIVGQSINVTGGIEILQ